MSSPRDETTIRAPLVIRRSPKLAVRLDVDTQGNLVVQFLGPNGWETKHTLQADGVIV